MSLRLQLKHATDAFRFANRCQTPCYVQVRSFSDSKQTVKELLVEVNKYRNQIDLIKNKNAKLTSKAHGYARKLEQMRHRNDEVTNQRNDTASHASTSEPVSSENEGSELTKQISHLLSVLAQDQKLRTKNANKKDPTSVELQSMQTSIKKVRRNVETLSNQVKKLQQRNTEEVRQKINKLTDQANEMEQDPQKVGELIFRVEKLQRQFDRSNGTKADSGKRSELISSKKASATEQKTTLSDVDLLDLNAEPNQVVDKILKMTKKLSDDKQYDKATEVLLFAIELEKTGRKDQTTLSRLWCKLARSYQRRKYLKRAFKAADEAVKLDPTRPITFIRRAGIYVDLGETLKASEDLQVALELRPGCSHAINYLRHIASRERRKRKTV